MLLKEDHAKLTVGSRWYLGRYINGQKNREKLSDWFTEQDVISWTPLTITLKIRSDSRLKTCYRKIIDPVFPGYMFLKLDPSIHRIDILRKHSLFIDFLYTGHQISSVPSKLVEGLMQQFPESALSELARKEEAAAQTLVLSRPQYQRLIELTHNPRPQSREALLFELIAMDFM